METTTMLREWRPSPPPPHTPPLPAQLLLGCLAAASTLAVPDGRLVAHRHGHRARDRALRLGEVGALHDSKPNQTIP